MNSNRTYPADITIGAQEPLRQTQIREQLVRLSNRLESLGKGLLTLDERLRPVLRPYPQSEPCNNKDGVQPQLVEYAETIRSYEAQLATYEEIVNGILSRLEA